MSSHYLSEFLTIAGVTMGAWFAGLSRPMKYNYKFSQAWMLLKTDNFN